MSEWISGLIAVPGMGPGSGTTLTSPDNKILFKNVNIFDGKTNGLQTAMNVLVEHNKISVDGKVFLLERSLLLKMTQCPFFA